MAGNAERERWNDGYAPQVDFQFEQQRDPGMNYDSGQFINSNSSLDHSDHFYAHVPTVTKSRSDKGMQPQKQPVSALGADFDARSRSSIFDSAAPHRQHGQASGNGDRKRASAMPSADPALISPKKSAARSRKQFASKQEEEDYWTRRNANNKAAKKSRAGKTQRLSDAEAKIQDLESRLQRSQNEILAQAETIDTLTKSNAALVAANEKLTTANLEMVTRNGLLEGRIGKARKIIEQNQYHLAIGRKAIERKDYEINDLKTTIARLSEKSMSQGVATGQIHGAQNQEYQNLSSWNTNNQWQDFDETVISSGFAAPVPQADHSFQGNQSVESSIKIGDLGTDLGDIDFSDEDLAKLVSEWFQPVNAQGGSQGNDANGISVSIDSEMSHTMQPRAFAQTFMAEMGAQ